MLVGIRIYKYLEKIVREDFFRGRWDFAGIDVSKNLRSGGMVKVFSGSIFYFVFEKGKRC